MKRRTFLQGTFAATAAGMAVSAGLLSPSAVLADWAEHKGAFEAESMDAAMKAIGDAEASDKVKIKAPDIAENGAVVPVTVSSDIEGVSRISILAEKNSQPLSAIFNLGEGAKAYVSTRLKIGKTGNVVAIVKAGDKSYKAHKEVKVTIGGCGG